MMDGRPPFLLRGAARAVDLLVQVALMEAAYRARVFLPDQGLIQLGDDTLFYVDLAVGMGALVLYTAISEQLGGATLGKYLTAMRVVKEDGSKLDLWGAWVRNLAFFVDGLFLGLVAYSAIARSNTGQRFGDEWGKTLVVWRSQTEHYPLPGWPVGMVVALLWVLLSYVVVS